jgi:hypothetical protein
MKVRIVKSNIWNGVSISPKARIKKFLKIAIIRRNYYKRFIKEHLTTVLPYEPSKE